MIAADTMIHERLSRIETLLTTILEDVKELKDLKATAALEVDLKALETQVDNQFDHLQNKTEQSLKALENCSTKMKLDQKGIRIKIGLIWAAMGLILGAVVGQLVGLWR